MPYPKKVTIKEVGPRDGLQNEPVWIATEDKITWINQLSRTGLSYIEITSFVHPKWIPALRDAIDVAKGIDREKGVTYAALVPNQRGLENALEGGINEACVFMSASETHNRKNINKSTSESLHILKQVNNDAQKANLTTRAYLSTVFGCPYEKDVPIEQVIRLSEALFEFGISELSLGDTIGAANPAQVETVLEALLARFPANQIALHFHDTRGTALANMVTALQMGITVFDGSAGGLGGCPYAPGSSGNAATEDIVYMLEQMDIKTNVKLEKLLSAAKWIEEKMGKPLPSRNLQVFKSS
ncbi:hydroxymethylglutaryl-CoA lyase [Bacillus subtilis subsp. subtilis]|uniref:Hydroxymethylglutaryl-CoA lyase YngG n=4 Tax=Bacillus subtilis subsp. subtilis TaxID=135461 RepID=HMGCL_BACSU|nr:MULTISPECIES: hydroxymethylglutaryl-CoA lyase [Bacillales]NP_389705.1 hydroxymethylglutaryl-CoA lyase (leucine degradation) [Bacillus subtilis subsp. subtilis str. 168]O34873.1 RecName: Full=Hydroxymethylglutaryl-CoA lyase YngG; Short=HL; Short=HMG-CoA lyase; AltName: Full=3-hydroxy-3-methylglutarate-CoA lyase [Bacillus subtilis subsp. subtilis str. 168]BAM52477.1 hydroxymethylglutaryl-CoA lyase [Bacillus subtilis BEST7613]AFQ57758.1 Putative hydroxymethylglutaryl-CoA lyase [Bacillus subtili